MLPGEGVKLSFKAFFISLCLNLAVIFFTMKTPGINLGKPKKNRLFLVARPLRGGGVRAWPRRKKTVFEA